MNIFNDAIETHIHWNLRLKQHIEEGIIQDLKKVADCHVCELGQWIYGDGVRYNNLPSFESMCTAHEHFHRIAAEVVYHSNANNKVKARSLLTAEGAFSQSSAKLIKALMNCSKDLSDSVASGIRNRRKVRDILHAKKNNSLFSIEDNSPVLAAIKIMTDHNIRAIAITHHDKFVGIFTERGYLQHLMYRGAPSLEAPVSEMMDINTICVDPDDSVEQCMILMTSTHTRHLPVMDQGKLVGILSIGDVISGQQKIRLRYLGSVTH
ncbi:CBS domain-containing protein [Methylomicrobium sp. Wu6]|uniref:CBS domain-containing protein n=1 Tax=Methylomicrobium sp. Wu6 TaxID=3107928 RepID=UPI002DD66B22|nr:CBS domain-containing protein [Methylomicrobium sp. Wu6]MEC4747942.1 CBS domain-containing protein [Methylomicrobium sp. Wu6]